MTKSSESHYEIQALPAKSDRHHAQSTAQRQRILDLLRERGLAGVTNFELNATCCMGFGATIYELRKMGFSIRTIREGDSEFRFVLVAEPEHPQPQPSEYDRRTRELHDRAMPLFAGVHRA